MTPFSKSSVVTAEPSFYLLRTLDRRRSRVVLIPPLSQGCKHTSAVTALQLAAVPLLCEGVGPDKGSQMKILIVEDHSAMRELLGLS
jgi:hypothetical protein